MTNRDSIVSEIKNVRLAQFDRGYTIEHDDQLGLNHLISEVQRRLARLEGFSTTAALREELKKSAAILVAAIEYIDRHSSEVKDRDSGE